MDARSALAALALTGAVPGSGGARELTFAEASARLGSANESLLAATEAVNARREERAATFGLHYPRLDANARYTRMDAPLTLDLNEIRDVILHLHPAVPPALVPSFVGTIQKGSFWLADVTLTWPVFTGGKIAAADRAAAARVDDAERDRQRTAEELTTELARRYFGLRLALKARDVRGQVLAALDTHAAQARRLEEEGMIARAERLHAEVARAEADREFKRAEHQVALARTALADTLATDDDALDPSTAVFLLRTVEPLQEFRARAAAGSPLLAKVAAQQALAASGVAADRADYFPDVYVFGRQELHKADLTIFDPGWAVGAGARLTLFDGFTRTRRVAAANDRVRQVALVEKKAARDLDTLVEQRYREMGRAREQFDALEAALDLAREGVRVRDLAFEEGMGTSLDIVDARLALSKVQLERLSAAYDFDVALAELLSACGEGARLEEYRARADVQVER